MDNYEELLDSAYENIEPCEVCERFEVKPVEGHFEGNKTIITNFCGVASCIRREMDHLAKFLFKELAAPGEIAGDRLILTRKVSSKNVNEKVGKYVEKYVKCKKCGKPDTEIAEEGEKKFLRCMACGEKREIHN